MGDGKLTGSAVPLAGVGSGRGKGTGASQFLYVLTRYKYLHLMLLPAVVWLIIFKYVPMAGIMIAFKNYRGVGAGFAGIFGSEWLGFKNFEIFLSSMYFGRVLGNTLLISFMRLVFAFPVPILFALLLNEIGNKYYKKVVQTISYMPYFLSWVIIAALSVAILSTDAGPLNTVLASLGLKPVFFLADKAWFRPVLVLTGIWRGAEWSSIIYLAVISGLPQDPYESALIDGASKLQTIRYITIPGIMEMIAIMLILQVGRAMTDNFEQIFNMYSPVVYDVADIFDTYVYRSGITEGRFS
jgi:putative aldouronate transport system permease protein